MAPRTGRQEEKVRCPERAGRKFARYGKGMVIEMKKRCTAVILAAGSGSRMKSKTAKQFMLLGGKPLIWHSLQAVENSGIIDDCIVVTGESDVAFVHENIIEKYGFRKVDAVVAGGGERCESVGNALSFIADGSMRVPNREGYIFIHDGARPFLTEELLRSTWEAVREHHACVAAVPSKDTVKLSDEKGFVQATPDRRSVWIVQTPQVFDAELIIRAYAMLRQRAEAEGRDCVSVTDDASVVELFTDCRVKLAEGSYGNIKITTPEDLKLAEALLANEEVIAASRDGNGEGVET